MLLLTNDGEWADRVLHPRHGVEREYAIALAAPLDRDQADALQAGIPLERGARHAGRAPTDDRHRGPAAGGAPPTRRLRRTSPGTARP